MLKCVVLSHPKKFHLLNPSGKYKLPQNTIGYVPEGV
jgi:hypothetical protein